jgi:hypothetical protein
VNVAKENALDANCVMKSEAGKSTLVVDENLLP